MLGGLGTIMRYLLGISLITLIIIAVRFALKGKISKKLQYMLWLFIPLYMIISPVFSINLTVPENSVIARQEQFFEQKTREDKPQRESVNREPPLSESGETALMDVQNFKKAETVPNHSELSHAEITAREAETTDSKSFDPKAAVTNIKNIVTCIFVIVLFIYNGLFIYYCKKRRTFLNHDLKSHLNVFMLKKIGSPFLLGRNIYLSDRVASDETASQYAIYHEYCHYKHGDALWAIVKYIVLALNWYNPLIWYAFILVEQDCELACDEEVLQHFGDERRIEYGKVLLSLLTDETVGQSNLTISTAMKGRNKKNIKDRIINIKNKSKCSVVAVMLSVSIMLSVSGFSLVRYSIEESASESEFGVTVSADNSWDSFEKSASEPESKTEETLESADVEKEVDILTETTEPFETESEVISEETEVEEVTTESSAEEYETEYKEVIENSSEEYNDEAGETEDLSTSMAMSDVIQVNNYLSYSTLSLTDVNGDMHVAYIPCLTIAGSDIAASNADMESFAIQCLEAQNPFYWSADFRVFDNGSGVISILQTLYGPYDDIYLNAVTVNLNTGSVLTNDDIMALTGTTEESLYDDITGSFDSRVEWCFERDYMCEEMFDPSSEMYEVIEHTYSHENVNSDMIMFIGPNGNLCASADFISLGGSLYNTIVTDTEGNWYIELGNHYVEGFGDIIVE